MKIIAGSEASENHLQVTLQQEKDAIIAIDHTHGVTHRLALSEGLVLDARGQDGKKGLIGRDGNPGLNGQKGRDATETSEATPGGDGGDGQAGEPGGHGTDAGNGGLIELSIAEEDLALLPCIKEVNLQPGKPGIAGRHGQGGVGGKGGYGGKGCHWVTTEAYTDIEIYQPPAEKRPTNRHGHSSHSHGHSHSHSHGHHASHSHGHGDSTVSVDVEYEWYTPPPIERSVRKTRFISHERPAAPDGRPGRSGYTPNYALFPGKKGSAGNYYIHVCKAGKTQKPSTHRSIYNLSIDATSEVPKMLEPGEAAVLNYKICNRGESMPSPQEAMPLAFRASKFFTCPQTITVAGSLEPAQYRMAYQPIQLKTIDSHQEADPYKAFVSVNVDLMNTRLNQRFATTEHVFTFCYPAVLSLGEQKLQIKNVSRKALGAAADRKLQIDVMDENHQAIDSFSIESLTERSIYTKDFKQLNFGSAAWYCTPKKHFIDLYLQPINNRDELVLTQEVPVWIHSLFKLNLISEDTQSGQFFEPGQEILFNYGIKNTSTTQYSPDERMQITITDSRFIHSKREGKIKGYIEPTKTVKADEAAAVTLKTIMHAKPTPFKENIRISAHLKSEGGEYAHHVQMLELRYPLNIDLATHSFSTEPGKTAPIAVVVNNVSAQPIEGRNVRLQITDQDHTVLSEHKLNDMLANESHTLKDNAAVKSKENDFFVEPTTYYVDLYLQPINKNDDLTLIQRQSVINKVLIKYNPVGHFTLVVDDTISSEDKKGWYYFIQALSGSYPAFYDATYYASVASPHALEGLLADNPYGTVALLAKTWLDKAINPKFLLETDKRYHGALMTAVSLEPLLTMTSDALLPQQNQPLVTMASTDAFIQDLLMSQDTTDPDTVYRIEQTLGCFHNANHYVNKLQTRLDHTFPNRHYQVSSQRLNANKINIFVQRLSNPECGKLGEISSNKLTTKTKEELIDNLPFNQKVNFFMKKTSDYRERLAESIKHDLVEEQNRISHTHIYGSFWQKKRNKFAQSQTDMRQLRNLVAQLKDYYHQGDFNAVNTWAPLVKDLLQAIKVQVESKIHVWDRILHFFSPQGKVVCARGARALCNEGLKILEKRDEGEVRSLNMSEASNVQMPEATSLQHPLLV